MDVKQPSMLKNLLKVIIYNFKKYFHGRENYNQCQYLSTFLILIFVYFFSHLLIIYEQKLVRVKLEKWSVNIAF
jgi:ssDNA-binding Zn-finger/Zn-ribbon topoisomerase 1